MGHLRLAPIVAVISLFALMVVVLATLEVPLTGAVSAIFAIAIAVPLAFVFAHGAEPGAHH